jgi:hypothetical protein
LAQEKGGSRHREKGVSRHGEKIMLARENQCCRSGMFIPYPGYRILIFTHPGSRIPDLKTVPKERDEKKFCYHTFFCSHKFHKIEYYVIFEMLKKKIWANFQRIFEVFTQKIFNMLSNIWVWDPGSEIRDPEKTYSGSRIHGSKRHL